MGNKLYVGNLSFSTNEQSLNQLFTSCGTVGSTKIIMDRDSGRSKGFGFIEMSSDTEAGRAIEMYDGHEFEGRQMKVSIAIPRENQGRNFNSNRARY